jgi:transposase
MLKPFDRIEVITCMQRRRRYTADEKIRLVEQTMQPGVTVSAVAWLHGVTPSLLFQWRRRMTEVSVVKSFDTDWRAAKAST